MCRNISIIPTGDPKPRVTSHLSPYDEQQLVAYMRFMALSGQPVSVEWVLNMAGRLASHRYIFDDIINMFFIILQLLVNHNEIM